MFTNWFLHKYMVLKYKDLYLVVIPCSSETLKILKNYYITNAYVKPIKPKYCIVESESIIELLLMKLNKKISNNYLLYTTLLLLWIFQNIFIALLKLVRLIYNSWINLDWSRLLQPNFFFFSWNNYFITFKLTLYLTNFN